MLGRLSCCLFLACASLMAGHAVAQSGPLPGMYQPYPDPVGGAYFPGLRSPEVRRAAMPPAGPPGLTPDLMTELLPADRGWFYENNAPLDLALRDTTHGMWFRLEYMNMFVDKPGQGLLGAPLANVPDPNDPFLIVTPGSVFLGARVLDTSTVAFENINGIRGAFGIPFQFGEAEAVFWASQESSTKIVSDQIPSRNPLDPVQVIVTSLLTDGDIGNAVIIYDRSFKAVYSNGMYSAEANFYWNYRKPRLGWRLQPMIGFRHFDYDEKLTQRGEFDNNSGASADPTFFPPLPFPQLITPLLREIDSQVDNSVYNAQFGFKTEFVHNFFVLGVEPKFSMGVNHYEATVRTNNLRDSPFPPVVDDGLVITHQKKDQFATIFDLNLYGKVRLNDWFSVRAGWNYLWFGSISRADQNIYYNDLGIANPPAVVARSRDRQLWMSGINVGMEVVLP